MTRVMQGQRNSGAVSEQVQHQPAALEGPGARLVRSRRRSPEARARDR